MLGIGSDDERAFSTLFEKYYSQIYGNTLRLVKVQAIAEDIVQQVFLQAWENRLNLCNVENPKAWLFQISRNLIADRFREKLTEERYLNFAVDLLDFVSDSPEDILINVQKQDLLARSLEWLSPRQKEVYHLSRQEGKTYQEIADQLGISKDTVKEYMQLALDKIRHYLLDHKDELISFLLLYIFFL